MTHPQNPAEIAKMLTGNLQVNNGLIMENMFPGAAGGVPTPSQLGSQVWNKFGAKSVVEALGTLVRLASEFHLDDAKLLRATMTMCYLARPSLNQDLHQAEPPMVPETPPAAPPQAPPDVPGL